VKALDPLHHVSIPDDETEMHYDLFLGFPKHRILDVVVVRRLGAAQKDIRLGEVKVKRSIRQDHDKLEILIGEFY
jgi:hypothetical protein